VKLPGWLPGWLLIGLLIGGALAWTFYRAACCWTMG
jgi:hypothetical protein